MFHPQSSDVQETPDWWIASDGRWYPPQLHPDFQAPPPPPMPDSAPAELASGVTAGSGVGDAVARIRDGAGDLAGGVGASVTGAVDSGISAGSGVGDAVTDTIDTASSGVTGAVTSGTGAALGATAGGAVDAGVDRVQEAAADIGHTHQLSEIPPLPTRPEPDPIPVVPPAVPDARATVPSVSASVDVAPLDPAPPVGSPVSSLPPTSAVPRSGPPVVAPGQPSSYPSANLVTGDGTKRRPRSIVAGLLALLGGAVAIVGSLLDWGEFSMLDASGAEQAYHAITSFESSGLITLIAGIGLALAGLFLLSGVPKQLLWAIVAFIGGAVVVATVIFSLIDIADLAERIKLDWEQRAVASLGDNFTTAQAPALWAVGVGGVLGVLAAPFVNRE